MNEETFEAVVKFLFETGHNYPAKEYLRVRYRSPENLRGEDIAEQLSSLLVEFDLTDGGKRLEPTVEVLEGLPLFALEHIAETVLSDYAPGKEEMSNLWLFLDPDLQGHSKAYAPADLWVYETALELGYSPAEVRSWNPRDRAWMMVVKGARQFTAQRVAQRTARFGGE
jgi:hypothetical protein